jgi:hypothetical protein
MRLSPGRPHGGARRRRIVDRSLLLARLTGATFVTIAICGATMRMKSPVVIPAKNRDDDAPVRAPTRIET